ncbi:hypothetical protein [Exiguobacterium sp. S3]|uniref:hypothetical protein n=1 Tax=Exiguobacterium sp. S3 TaxID=483245 RepID=UPI001BE74807|nr:hypothetical protein [Exiguobacterium sp. S3]
MAHSWRATWKRDTKPGAEFDHIVGDATYSSRDILIYAASQGYKLVAPLNPQVYPPAANRGTKGHRKEPGGNLLFRHRAM